jgi:hypothetical protein
MKISRLPNVGLVATLGVLVVAVAGCGSAASTSTTTLPPSPTTSATTTTNEGAPPCSTGVLAATASFGGGAAGTEYYTVSVKNSGPAKCALDGYPSYSFFAPSGAGGAGAGAAVKIAQTHGGPAPAAVVIAPGAQADAIIVYSDVSSGGTNCTSIASALLTPPGSTESLPFPIAFAPCGGGVTIYAFGDAGSETP